MPSEILVWNKDAIISIETVLIQYNRCYLKPGNNMTCLDAAMVILLLRQRSVYDTLTSIFY